MPRLKQGTLLFASTKPTNSTPSGKVQKRAAVTKKGKNKRVKTSKEAQTDVNSSEFLSSDEDVVTAEEITVPAKRTCTRTKTHVSSMCTEKSPSKLSGSTEQNPSLDVIKMKHLDIEDKAGRYREYYEEVRTKMGYMEPIHSEGQNKVHRMLRFFDMSYEFGPCIGMTRLERWKRAEAFGLNPPAEIRDILLTKEGAENDEYSRCLLDGEV